MQKTSGFLIFLVYFSAALAHAQNHSGPYNFGIGFSPVDREVAQRFWQAYDNPQNLIKSLTPADYVKNEFTPVKSAHPYARMVSLVVQEYMSAMPDWVKLSCASPDMNAYQKGRLVFAETTKKLASRPGPSERPAGRNLDQQYVNLNAYWAAQLKAATPSTTIYTCNFERKYGYDLKEGEPNETLDSALIAKPEWQIIADPRRIFILRDGDAAKVSVGLSAKNTRTNQVWYGTKFGRLLEDGDEVGDPDNAPTAIRFLVVDDYLIPSASHGISKGFPVPIAKFDRMTGKILSYYDFGLLLLEGFPADKPLILTTVASERKMNDYVATRDLKVFGAPRSLLATHLDQYVSMGQMPASSTFWNYDRIPVGSVHFMINSFWMDGYSGAADGNALLAQFSKEEIKSLYLNGGAWINTYDGVNTSDVQQAETYSSLFKGNCEFALAPQNFAAKMRLSHEIILGGAAGRAALAKAKVVAVVKGQPLK